MNLVIDASVIIKWFVDEIGSDEARRLLINERFRFCAPAHAFGEIGNALATHVRQGALPRIQVSEIAGSLSDQVQTFAIESLLATAIGMALDLGASVYNALYIALAADLDTVFVTADVRLIRSMRGTGWHDRVLSVAAALR